MNEKRALDAVTPKAIAKRRDDWGHREGYTNEAQPKHTRTPRRIPTRTTQPVPKAATGAATYPTILTSMGLESMSRPFNCEAFARTPVEHGDPVIVKTLSPILVTTPKPPPPLIVREPTRATRSTRAATAERRCSICGEWKHADAFHLSINDRLLGRQYMCRPCRIPHSRQTTADIRTLRQRLKAEYAHLWSDRPPVVAGK